MGDNLVVLGTTYEGVSGFKVNNSNGNQLKYIKDYINSPDPTDSYIHVWINLAEGFSKSVEVFAGNSESDFVDFGDGSDPVYIASVGGSWKAGHTYESYGVYEIIIHATALLANNNIVKLSGGSNLGRRLIKRLYIPSTFPGTIGQYKLQSCYALERATIGGTTGIGMYAFSGCYTLREIVLPEGLVTISNNAFQNCHTVTKVVIPSTVTSIDTNAFNTIYAPEFHIKPTTPPTLSSTNAFSSGDSNAVFYVPYSSDHSILESYKTATNWSTYAAKMQEEPT